MGNLQVGKAGLDPALAWELETTKQGPIKHG